MYNKESKTSTSYTHSAGKKFLYKLINILLWRLQSKTCISGERWKSLYYALISNYATNFFGYNGENRKTEIFLINLQLNFPWLLFTENCNILFKSLQTYK